MKDTRDAILFALPLAVLMVLHTAATFAIIYIVDGEISTDSPFFWIMIVAHLVTSVPTGMKMVSLATDFLFFCTREYI